MFYSKGRYCSGASPRDFAALKYKSHPLLFPFGELLQQCHYHDWFPISNIEATPRKVIRAYQA